MLQPSIAASGYEVLQINGSLWQCLARLRTRAHTHTHTHTHTLTHTHVHMYMYTHSHTHAHHASSEGMIHHYTASRTCTVPIAIPAGKYVGLA